MRLPKHIYVSTSILLLLVSLSIIWGITLSNWGYSCLMCINFAWVLYMVWKAQKFSPFITFLATFTLMFIGGRFWAVLVYPDNEEDLRRGNFFDWNPISQDLWLQTLTFILLFIYLASLAYILYPRKNADQPVLINESHDHTKVDAWLRIVFGVLAPFTLYDVITKYIDALSGGGYMSLYLEQTENVSAGSGLIASMLYVFLGIALVYGNPTTKKLYLILIFLKAFGFIMIGQRAKFGAMLLFLLWYYLRNKKVNIGKIALLGALSLFVLLWITSLSLREADNEDVLTPMEMLSMFFFSQGVSLTTFTCSQQVIGYPIVPYFVSFIPGFASAVTFFSSLPASHAAFANYLAYTLNPSVFEAGHGLGWTLLSDLYLYSGRTFTLFALWSVVFGLLCSYIEDKSRTSPLAATIVYAVFLNLTFLPRAGLYTVLPLTVWVLVVHYLFIRVTGFDRIISFEKPENNIESQPEEKA